MSLEVLPLIVPLNWGWDVKKSKTFFIWILFLAFFTRLVSKESIQHCQSGVEIVETDHYINYKVLNGKK